MKRAALAIDRPDDLGLKVTRLAGSNSDTKVADAKSVVFQLQAGATVQQVCPRQASLPRAPLNERETELCARSDLFTRSIATGLSIRVSKTTIHAWESEKRVCPIDWV